MVQQNGLEKAPYAQAENGVGRQSAITTTAECVNATTARLWLGQNTNNRPLDPKRVRHYAQQMTEGRWQESGETIQFGEDGALIDGQHRLHALVRAADAQPDFTMRFQVVRNVPNQVFAVIGQGKPRTAADVLSLAGYVDARNLSSVASYHLRAAKQAWGHSLPDNDSTVSYVNAHGEALTKALSLKKPITRVVIRPTLFMALAAHALERGVPFSSLHTFAVSLRDGANLASDSPALALRNWSLQQRLQRATPPTPEDAYAIFRALQAHIHGKPLRRMGSALTAANITFDVEDLSPERSSRKR